MNGPKLGFHFGNLSFSIHFTFEPEDHEPWVTPLSLWILQTEKEGFIKTLVDERVKFNVWKEVYEWM